MPGPKHGLPRRPGSRKVFNQKHPDGIARTPNKKQAKRLKARQEAFVGVVSGCTAHMPGSQNRKK